MARSNREPLSDITKKFNITPTPALVKLFAASSSSNLLPNRPPSNSNSSNLKPFSESSSKSSTSIGSSNVSVASKSKKTVQFRSPPPVISTINSSGGIRSKDAAHNRRQITENSKKEREADVIVIHTPVEKRKDKRKAIAVPLSSSPSEKTKDNRNGNGGIFKHTRSSNLIIKETGQEFLNPSCFVVPRAKDSRKPLNTVDSHEKTRDKGKAIQQPLGIIEIAEHNGSSTDVAVKSRPPRRKSEKRKFDVGAFSCPPIENNLSEAGDVKSLKSCTDPNLKLRKKTCSRIKRTSNLAQDSIDKLPEDFVEQQRAYFKEVDEFELAEEEVSPDELD